MAGVRQREVTSSMIYRCKTICSDELAGFMKRFCDTYRALMRPHGAALFVSENRRGELLVVLTQHYSDIFELISPGFWESLYDPDTSTYRFLGGDRGADPGAREECRMESELT